jgi:two-component SAPR family response regulator
VDDEKLILDDTVSKCREMPQIREVEGFTRPAEALAWLEQNAVDLVLLDIDMPGMNGLEMAATIKEKWPEISICFLTGYSKYAVDAFSVRATGYLLKPVSKKRLEEEVSYALSEKKRLTGHIVVQTFGNFDLWVDGKLVGFRMAKCKEILAYLIDKHGTSVTRAEISAMLWEDRLYNRKLQKQLDVYIRSLRETLRDYNIEEIFEMQKGSLRIRPEQITCDAYLFFDGDSEIVNSYRGEYMSAYSWASMTESLMYWKVMGKA